MIFASGHLARFTCPFIKKIFYFKSARLWKRSRCLSRLWNFESVCCGWQLYTTPSTINIRAQMQRGWGAGGWAGPPSELWATPLHWPGLESSDYYNGETLVLVPRCSMVMLVSHNNMVTLHTSTVFAGSHREKIVDISPGLKQNVCRCECKVHIILLIFCGSTS